MSKRIEEQYINETIKNINIKYNKYPFISISNLDIKKQSKRYITSYTLCEHDLIFKRILLENTGITVEPDNVIRFLKWKLNLKDWQFNKKLSYNDVESIEAEYFKQDDTELVINIPDIKENKDIIIKILNRFGYYLSEYHETDIKDQIVMLFHPAYIKPITNTIKEKYKYLYHIIDIKNKYSILQKGFIPKSDNDMFNYPKRCHFFVDINSALEFRDELNKKQYVLFIIDINKLNNDLYPDPNIRDSVITKDKVKPNTIIDYKIIDTNTI